MTLTPAPPGLTPAQQTVARRLRKLRSATPRNPRLEPAYLADERRYELDYNTRDEGGN
jgi:hypothetical protein